MKTECDYLNGWIKNSHIIIYGNFTMRISLFGGFQKAEQFRPCSVEVCSVAGSVRVCQQRGTHASFPFLWWLLLLVGCLTSQQHASVSPGRICSDKFTCCHTEIEVADPTFYLTQSQYTNTGPTSPSTDPVTPGAWQGSHWSANF